MRAEFIGLNPCDTLVTVSGTTCTDTLQLVLTLPYDYIEEYVCSPELSREYINKGHPNLKLVIPIEQDKKVREHIFWKKYGVKYYSYYPLKENGKMDCYLNTPNRLLTAYNREVFRYLDEKYGKTWREEVPPGIFGLDKSLDELRDESWLIKTLNRRCKYPIVWQKKNKGRVLRVAYEVNQDGYITTATILSKTPVHSENRYWMFYNRLEINLLSYAPERIRYAFNTDWIPCRSFRRRMWLLPVIPPATNPS